MGGDGLGETEAGLQSLQAGDGKTVSGMGVKRGDDANAVQGMDMNDPFAIAVAAGIRAGMYSAVSRDLGGLKGLDRLAGRYSALASDAVKVGLRRLGLDEPDPAVAPAPLQRGDD